MAEIMRSTRAYQMLSSRCLNCSTYPVRSSTCSPDQSIKRLPIVARRWDSAHTRSKRSMPLGKQMSRGRAARAAEQAGGGEMRRLPDDIGLLPSTFVTPLRSQRPSWTSATSARWRWEKARLKARLIDIGSMAVYKYLVSPTHPEVLSQKPWYARLYTHLFIRHDLETRQIPSICKTLYEQMYRSLASGEIDAIRPVLCENVYSSLSAKVRDRGNTSTGTGTGRSGYGMKWTLHEYLDRTPKLVSYKGAVLDVKAPKHEMDAIQQAVVRIRSLQSLERTRGVVREGRPDEDGKVVPREVVEYFVVQKMLRKGVAGPWKIWGTTQPTNDVSLGGHGDAYAGGLDEKVEKRR